MRLDELKQSLTRMAEEADDQGIVQRLAAVEHKVATRRRTTVAGAVLAAAVGVAATAIAPSLVDPSDERPRPADRVASLPTVTDHGIAFYTEPAGAKLIGHGVADPGTEEISFTFIPATTNLSYDAFCSDPGVDGPRGAEYTSFVNGHQLSRSTCQGRLARTPVTGGSTFGSSPTSNASAWQHDFDVVAGEPSTFTVRITNHAERGDAVQPGAAVYEDGLMAETDGVWYDKQVVYLGHTYQVVDATVAVLERDGRTVVTVDLPSSDYPIYVARGAEHVRHGLSLARGSHGLIQLGRGVTAGGTGDLVRPDKPAVTIVAKTNDVETTGLVYVLVYTRID
ncbi:MAG: hypothetical protein ACR2LE_06225 [Nocardioidaceae bacterium]